MNYPRVAIVILNYNGLEDTTKCLHSLLQTKYPNFIIRVADNGSKKNEAKILSLKFRDKRIRFFRFTKNLGFTGGNNKIIRKLKDRYIALLNNDIEVAPNWLSPLIEMLEKDKSIAVIQPKILWSKNKKYFDYAGAGGGYIDFLGYPFTRGRIFETQEIDRGQYDSATEIFWTSGAAMITRRDIFKKVGYFDERFFNYMEEIDFCFRAHQAGYKIVCEPRSVVFHKVAGTASRDMFQKRYLEHRNNLLLILKNFPSDRIIFVLPGRLVFEYISIFYYLYRRQFVFALAVFKSQLSFAFLFIPTLLTRIHKRTISNKKLIHLLYSRSIVVDYFFLKKKKYSQLQFKT